MHRRRQVLHDGHDRLRSSPAVQNKGGARLWIVGMTTDLEALGQRINRAQYRNHRAMDAALVENQRAALLQTHQVLTADAATS